MLFILLTKMRSNWFHLVVLLCGLVFILGASGFVSMPPQMEFQTDVFITVTYDEPINVRSGPSTVLYDIIGNLQPGDTAPALGMSPGQDWVKISFPSGPRGEGWVYIALVSLSPGNLRVVEPPPTSTPLVTATIDPTLAAAYVFEPTATRLPTFTPAPRVVMPQFTEVPAAQDDEGFPMGYLVLGLGIPGLLGYFATTIRRRR